MTPLGDAQMDSVPVAADTSNDEIMTARDIRPLLDDGDAVATRSTPRL